ncbi:MAG: hypothetical protein AABP62_17375 [Planctomycetota bacterium]
MRYSEADTFGVAQKPSSDWGKPGGGRGMTSVGGIRMAGLQPIYTADSIKIAGQLN